MPLDSSRSFPARTNPAPDTARPLPVTQLLSAGLSGPGAAAILSFMIRPR